MEKELEIDNEALKSQIAIRCAKAALLLSSLKSPPDHNTGIDDKERARLLKMVADLRVELVRERYKSKHIKICSIVEFALQIMVLLSIAGFCLILASCPFI
ncbi:hypothetical protein MRB53_000174 [Persea americana]|uniref:Uncharacterized protein n=1 Tax=Persea americana TaxID=3435 RepID=A0ACC2MP20_PERAE|nr:hypothetical protein MRB53_000174 [Persea americana]